MQLLIDLGNSRLKWWLYAGAQQVAQGGLLDHADWRGPDLAHLGALAAGPLRRIGICSVVGEAQTTALCERLLGAYAAWPDLQIRVLRSGESWLQASQTPLKISADYRLDQLGPDRWAAVLGLVAGLPPTAGLVSDPANASSPQLVALVSAGTATVVDFVELLPASKDGSDESGGSEAGASQVRLCGGYLLPGWQLMREALLGGTAGIATAMARTSSENLGQAKWVGQTEQAAQTDQAGEPKAFEPIGTQWPRDTAAAVEAGLAAAQLGPLLLQPAPSRLVVHGGAAPAFLAAYAAHLAPHWGLTAEHQPDLLARGLKAWTESF